MDNLASDAATTCPDEYGVLTLSQEGQSEVRVMTANGKPERQINETAETPAIAGHHPKTSPTTLLSFRWPKRLSSPWWPRGGAVKPVVAAGLPISALGLAAQPPIVESASGGNAVTCTFEVF